MLYDDVRVVSDLRLFDFSTSRILVSFLLLLSWLKGNDSITLGAGVNE